MSAGARYVKFVCPMPCRIGAKATLPPACLCSSQVPQAPTWAVIVNAPPGGCTEVPPYPSAEAWEDRAKAKPHQLCRLLPFVTWLLTLLSTACQSPSPLLTCFSLKIKAKVFTGPILAFSRELRLGPRQTLVIAGLLGTHHLTLWGLVTMPTATRVTGRSHSLSTDSAHLVPGRTLASVPFLSHKPFLVPRHVQWDPLTDDIR